MAFYERLSAMDASFLGIEDGNCHMHVGGVMIFDAAPLRTADGGHRHRRASAEPSRRRLHLVPRFRQRVDYIPYERLPIWVDDDRFRLAYHVRHTALPRPGDERVLKRVVGRHHVAAAGPPASALGAVGCRGPRRRPLRAHQQDPSLHDRRRLGRRSDVGDHEPASGGRAGGTRALAAPRTPSGAELLVHEVIRRVAQPITAAHAVSEVVRSPEPEMRKVADAVAGLMEAIAPALNPVSPTPLNVEIGPHRRFEWLEMRIADVKAVKKALGGTLNDVVLAIVSGALRTLPHPARAQRGRTGHSGPGSRQCTDAGRARAPRQSGHAR